MRIAAISRLFFYCRLTEKKREEIARSFKKWHAQDVGMLQPRDSTAVRKGCQEAGIDTADDLITLYTTLGGMKDNDDKLWRLWDLSEVVSRKSEANKFGVLFSDYLCESWSYRVKPNDTETSAVYLDDGISCRLIAATLEHFFAMYADNAERLLEEWPRHATR